MGCIISIIATVVTLNCPTPVSSAQDAARILSPRQFVAPAPVEHRVPIVIERARPVAPAPRESEVGRAIRMGIPGGYTALEWAILNGGR
jgi:hypothetical protein